MRIHALILEHLFTSPKVPTPAEFADWLEAQPQRRELHDADEIIKRLRAWGNRAYPPLPDDDALMLAMSNRRPDPRWWVPGATPPPMPSAIRSLIRENR